MRRSLGDVGAPGLVAGVVGVRGRWPVGPIPGRFGPLVGVGRCVGSLHPLVCGCCVVGPVGGRIDASVVVGCERAELLGLEAGSCLGRVSLS